MVYYISNSSKSNTTCDIHWHWPTFKTLVLRLQLSIIMNKVLIDSILIFIFVHTTVCLSHQMFCMHYLNVLTIFCPDYLAAYFIETWVWLFCLRAWWFDSAEVMSVFIHEQLILSSIILVLYLNVVLTWKITIFPPFSQHVYFSSLHSSSTCWERF